MRLMRVGPVGAEIPVLCGPDGCLYDLRGLVKDIDGNELADGGLSRIAAAHSTGKLPVLDGTHRRIGSPVKPGGSIICVGMNYAAHAAEAGAEPPDSPVLFLKPPNTLCGPNDRGIIPRNSRKTDWEVELAVIIGKRALYLNNPNEAIEHIAGFAAANDLSEREFQIEISGGQWSKGKSAPGFTPLGPMLVSPDEVNYRNLRLRSWVNGESRQDSSTADMIFDVEYLVWNISQYMALDPGDVILTGTPQGVALSGKFPYISAGDQVRVEIEGLGSQTQEFVNYNEPNG